MIFGSSGRGAVRRQSLRLTAGRPDRQLDHILTDDAGLVVDSSSSPTLPISDHRPLIIDVSRR